MKQFVAKLLVFLFIISFTPMKEMIKVPLLLVHYYEHLDERPNMTIGEFLDMHYMHGIVFDADYEKDMQLPFKVMDFASLPIFVFNEYKLLDIISKESSFFVKNKINASYRFNLSDAKNQGIFHPPKFS
ncbi:MAG: hypothetical protein WAT22_10335 [Saprospiraceae bacterium]|nr:hypothetical protein [Saprospiraceae bacterium]MBK9566263.1 hypothetical protein [Saprospiraceae bacterium]MBP6447150.1 hypothetical protein [Saprospiraceae bacterium]